MNCTTCSKLIIRPPSQSKYKNIFCNHTCYSIFKSKKWKQEDNPRWTGGLQEYKCESCESTFKRKRNHKENSLYCSQDCAIKKRGLKIKGNKHWNWKGGKDLRYKKKIAPRPKPDKCEVCKTPSEHFKKGICYDHNHQTGEFRGWLCGNCNTTLGLVKDNVDTLKSLIIYLENQ
jgi:hypothetical protein